MDVTAWSVVDMYLPWPSTPTAMLRRVHKYVADNQLLADIVTRIKELTIKSAIGTFSHQLQLQSQTRHHPLDRMCQEINFECPDKLVPMRERLPGELESMS